MVIVKDLDMPGKCRECIFCSGVLGRRDGLDLNYRCRADKKFMNITFAYFNEERSDFCPLVEVK